MSGFLAAFSDYVMWWQPPLLIAIVASVFGGGALLLVGRRVIAKQPGARYVESVATVILGGFIAVPAQTFVYYVASLVMGGQTVACLGAGLLAFLVGLLVFVLTIKCICRLSFAKAFLAWLPLLAVQVVQAAVVALLVLMLQHAQLLADRTNCMSNLAAMSRAIVAYKAEHDGNWPADIPAMRTAKLDDAPLGSLLCSCVDDPGRPVGRTVDYFYKPPESDDAGGAIVACDFGNNHRDGSRNVLFADGTFGPMSAAAFQVELAQPANADFAKALRQAEGAAAPTPAGRQ